MDVRSSILFYAMPGTAWVSLRNSKEVISGKLVRAVQNRLPSSKSLMTIDPDHRTSHNDNWRTSAAQLLTGNWIISQQIASRDQSWLIVSPSRNRILKRFWNHIGTMAFKGISDFQPNIQSGVNWNIEICSCQSRMNKWFSKCLSIVENSSDYMYWKIVTSLLLHYLGR
jgi:hypothetical protein